MRGGPSTVRVMTSSRSDVRSTVVRALPLAGSLCLPASIGRLLLFQFLDDLVQRVETGGPEPAVFLDPGCLFRQSAEAELAGPHASDLLRRDQPRLLQDADVLLHAREGHVELVCKLRDRSIPIPELLQNAASRGVRERGEENIEAGCRKLNHVVQCIAQRSVSCKAWPRSAAG